MQQRLLLLFFSLVVSLAGYGQSIGLIGSATPKGWDADTNMTQDASNADLWTLKITLIKGEVKFRQDDKWDVNWGDSEFPFGTGTQGGSNIPIPADGEYTIKFNAKTGAYEFSVKSDIGIIGSAAPKGWDEDVNMFRDPADSTQYTITLRLLKGAAKFRKDDKWDVNWGAKDFPSGIGTQNGPDIPIDVAGKYEIKFNTATGAYEFKEVVEFKAIGVIGTATAGGWDSDTDLARDGGNPDLWKGNIALKVGELKFRANDAWTLNWGDTTFPSGIAKPNGPNLKIPKEAEYQISFNTKTLEYKFLEIGNYSRVGIIGDATPGGWENDTPLKQDPSDKSIWTLRLILKNGEAKFRANNDWAINWGAGDFPKGTGEQDGPNIPIPAGEYRITFNSTTGEYNFEKLVVYSTVGIIGPATPVGNWDADVDMTKDAVDESFWFITSIELKDGEAKFRAENDWKVNWGLAQWPNGVGKQDGPNIPITAGTYRVTLNSATGEYGFGDPSSGTFDILKSNSVTLSPNPATTSFIIDLNTEVLRGDVRLIIFDQLGRQVMTQKMNLQNAARVDVSSLTSGSYIVHIANDKYIVGKQLVIVK